MTDYLTWCEETRKLPLDLKGTLLVSANQVSVISIDENESLLLKIVRDETKYVPRLKILGEVGYSLLDYYINPAERVTPNVCPVSPSTLWRQFIDGIPGEKWRGNLYAEKGSLESADLVIVDNILENRYAQRIALLDFLTVNQDRSARNWVIDNRNHFWGVDNGIFWPYKGRHTDKKVIRTGKVNHLKLPMDAIISYDLQFSFQIGVFSSLFAGHMINEGLLMWLNQIKWEEYFNVFAYIVCKPLEYPYQIVDDWRFGNVRRRVDWLLDKRCFPSLRESQSDEWQKLISPPKGAKRIWARKWEMKHLGKG